MAGAAKANRRWETAGAYALGAAEAIAETLWPTRCAVCDAPGELVCDRCRMNLPYLDLWRACPRCGAAFGRTQCTECNAVSLAGLDRQEVPYDACASAVSYEASTARIVKTWKDAGERRLADDMAHMMADVAPRGWPTRDAAVTFVPATGAAVRRRGFDHAEDLARRVAARLDLPCCGMLATPRARDQRALARSERRDNMAGRFAALPGASVPRNAVLVDDVCTTGSTLFAAADALRDGGAEHVFCLTFARV